MTLPFPINWLRSGVRRDTSLTPMVIVYWEPRWDNDLGRDVNDTEIAIGDGVRAFMLSELLIIDDLDRMNWRDRNITAPYESRMENYSEMTLEELVQALNEGFTRHGGEAELEDRREATIQYYNRNEYIKLKEENFLPAVSP